MSGSARWSSVLILVLGVALAAPAESPPGDHKISITVHRLEALGVALEAYIVDNNGLPIDAGLRDLYDGAPATPALNGYLLEFYPADAWNSPWQYRPDLTKRKQMQAWPSPGYSRDLTTGFTIASAGAHRGFGTPDDIVVRDGEVVAIPAGLKWSDILSPDEAKAETRRRALRIEVSLRRTKEVGSAWPADLSSLSATDLPAEARKDAWGNEFRYTKEGRRFALTSPGADGTFGTSDDLLVAYPPRF